MLNYLFGLLVILMSSPLLASSVVVTAPINKTELTKTFTAAGEVVSVREVDIAMEVVGKLDWVAQVGTFVQEGQSLATLDTEKYELQLASHLAYIAQLKSEIEYAQRAVKRSEALSSKKSISEQALDDIRQPLILATLTLEKAEIDRQLLMLKLKQSHIKAPFDGQVVTRNKVEGAFVEQGDVILTFVDIHNKEVSAKLPVLQLAHLQQGKTKVTIHLTDHDISGSIKSVVQAGDEHSRLAEVRIISDALSSPISTPLQLTINSLYSRQIWAVPRDALVVKAGKSFVYQISHQGKAKRVEVNILNEKDKDTVMLEGDLIADEKVVVRGMESLSAGMDVVTL
ncbi:efflux RND transporter periplasmic adaptor subunit [uncultured Shewanella sp.]|uniref:efflux RND transporter periplasmic adaptor subunit n=1 Tax=uncultured Shewanella sp. TaxID=173975 RepID=UPI002605CBCF|nr:efflux RND transporter periplasmic adaptor subunit [uncultured Shewanella sp.]